MATNEVDSVGLAFATDISDRSDRQGKPVHDVTYGSG